jgi:hypothetical protein
MGIDEAEVQLGKVNVFFGPNGSGKSSIIEGLLLPVFGTTPRQDKKNQWGHMIKQPHKNAQLFVQVEDKKSGQPMVHELEARINPKSNSMSPLKDADVNDRILLDPLAFFDLPAKVKADLAGDVRLDPTVLEAKLKERGIQLPILRKVIDIILSYRLSGAEKVLENCRLDATRAVQDPGSPPTFSGMMEPSHKDLEDMRAASRSWRDWITKYSGDLQVVAGIKAKQASKQANIERLKKVLDQDQVPDKFRRQAELDSVESRVSDARRQLDQLTQQSMSMEMKPCPTCGTPYNADAKVIAAKISGLQLSIGADSVELAKLVEEKHAWESRLVEQSFAKTQLADLSKEPTLQMVDEAELQAKLESARKAEQDWEQMMDRAAAFLTAKKFWEERKQASAMNQAIRDQWDLAVKTVRDPAFKSSLAEDPMERVRARLQVTAPFFKMAVTVTNELDVFVNGRPWWLLSQAQKLEASIVLADAFAHVGGGKILKVDGVDTLVNGHQRALIDFLRHVAPDYDTILLALAVDSSKPTAYTYLEELKASGVLKEPFASWFWIHQNESGMVTATLRQVL